MENASKALLIAGGMLLAILVVTLINYAWGSISKYQNSQIELKNIENVSKFNEQFAQYERNDVTGNEIISLVNKVADYNERYTTQSTRNTDTYSPISLTINFNKNGQSDGESNRRKLCFDNTSPQLFEWDQYKNDGNNKMFSGIINDYDEARKSFSKESGGNIELSTEQANKLAKNIDNIFVVATGTEDNYNEKLDRAINLYNAIANTNYNKNDASQKNNFKNNFFSNNETNRNNKPLFKDACKLYEFMQFKRCIFECTTLSYDNVTGRVSNMVFNFKTLR